MTQTLYHLGNKGFAGNPSRTQTFVHKCRVNLSQTRYNRYPVTVPIIFTSSPHPHHCYRATSLLSSQPFSHSLLSVTLYLAETVVSSTNKSPLCHFCSFKCWKAIRFVFMIPQTWSQGIRFKSLSLAATGLWCVFVIWKHENQPWRLWFFWTGAWNMLQTCPFIEKHTLWLKCYVNLWSFL